MAEPTTSAPGRPSAPTGAVTPMLGAFLRRVRRSPVTFWTVSVVAALVGAAVLRDAGIDRSQPWGALRPAVVATRSLGPGHRLRADDLRAENVPARFVPPGAEAAISSVLGRTIGVAVAPGSVIGPEALTQRAAGPLAAVAGPARAVVAVEARPGALPLRVGDLVTMLVTSDGPGPATVVARQLEVVERGEGRVSIAVGTQDLPTIAAAITSGVVTLALEGG